MAAAVRLCERPTGVASEGRRCVDAARAVLLATVAARCGAIRPMRPRAHHAVNGAALNIALVHLAKLTTRNAAVAGMGGDGARAAPRAAAARTSALSPVFPFVHHAVNRARLFEAFLHLHEGGAHVAASQRALCDRPASRLGATAACLAAIAPRTEVGHGAVHWAIAVGTCLGGACCGTRLATVCREDMNRADARLLARPTRGGAR